MATSRDELKSYFKQFSTPTESQFAKLIDATPNLNDDGLEKSTGTPLKIQAGSDGTLLQAFAFNKSFADKDASADWTIQLKAPGAAGASGLAIVKGGSTAPVLFIDEASGKININGTIKAGLDNASLKIEDSKILIKPGVIFEDQPITWLGGYEKFGKISDLPGNAAIFNDSSPEENALMIVGRKRNLDNDKRQVVKIYNLLQVEGPIVPKVGNDENSGIQFPLNAFGGAGDSASIRYYNQPNTENTVLEIKNMNDINDGIRLHSSGYIAMSTPQGEVSINSKGCRLLSDSTFLINSKIGFNLNSDACNIGSNTFKISSTSLLQAESQSITLSTPTKDGNINIKTEGDNSDISITTASGVIKIKASKDIEIVGQNVKIWNFKDMSNTFGNSDRRIKTDIAQLKYGLDQIKLLNPVSFNWKTNPNSDRTLGLIAQDVKPIISEIVEENEDIENGGGWRINYMNLIPVLINAIKELDQKIASLQRKHEKP